MIRMKFKYCQLFIGLLILSLNADAQTLTTSAIASQAEFTTNKGIQLSWTIGSQANETHGKFNSILTQGFEQPELQVWTGSVKVNMPLCGTGTININYTASGIINPGNIFTAELSDPKGSFDNPTIVGASRSNVNGMITGIITRTVLPGIGYRVRVSSSIPSFTGPDNGYNIEINKTIACEVTDITKKGADTKKDNHYDLSIKASPNPTTSYFILKPESSNTKDEINLRILNLQGNVIELRTHLTSGQVVEIGNSYLPGSYQVEISQGTKTYQQKLIKL